jgi:hypothetical protein
MMHPVARLKRTIGDLLRDKSLIERCRPLPPEDIGAQIANVMASHEVPIRNIVVTPLSPDQDCRYCVSYELDESGERQAQRFFRRTA